MSRFYAFEDDSNMMNSLKTEFHTSKEIHYISAVQLN